MPYIDSINSHIKSIETAITRYIGDDSGTVDDLAKKISFDAQIQTETKNIYKFLNLSVISGEYVDIDNFESKINDIILKIRETVQVSYSNENEKALSPLYNVIKSVTRDLDLYKLQVHCFYKSINNPKSQLIDYDILSDDDDKYLQDDIIPLLTLLESVFHENINLMLIDREFMLHEQMFQHLNKICHKLKSYSDKLDEEYIKILIYKCHILWTKFHYKDDIDSLRLSYNYYNGKDEAVLNLAEDITSDIISKIKKIYIKDSKEYEHQITCYFNVCSDKCTTFWDFFIKCHYFKNIVHNKSLLKKLANEFKLFQKDILSDFDKKNALFCQNYLNNCLLSLVLKDENTDPTVVWGEYISIKSTQDLTNTRNYFPFLKISEWYSKYLSVNMEYINCSTDLMQILNLFENNLITADKYLTESKYNAGCFIPFKPSLTECMDKHMLGNGETINVFISSSFIIPVDYDKEEKRIKRLHSDLIKFKAIIDAHKKVSSIIDNLQNETKILKQEVNTFKIQLAKESNNINNQVQLDLKENQKNNIQILAIFAGIVTFASGTIQIFKGASNIKDATIFMLLFASALSIVSLSISLVSTSKQKWDITKTIFSIILFLIIGLNAFAIFGNWGGIKIN